MSERESRTVAERLMGFDRRMKIMRLIVAAIALHLTVAVIIFLAGRFALFPSAFDTNGIGISFAPDVYNYRAQAVMLSEILTSDGATAWLTAPAPLHVKLYSLSFAVFGPLFGFNILSAEPLNVLYYLAILSLVGKLGQEVFDRRVGLLAAGAVALWPSFLIHTTQLLRDPLFIAAVLALVLITAGWLTRVHSWGSGLVFGAMGGVLSAVLWIVRSEMREVMLAVALLGVGLLVIRQVRERRVLTGNLIGAALLLVITLSIPRAAGEVQKLGATPEKTSIARPILPLWQRIAAQRYGFLTYNPAAGSNIDTDVQFANAADIARYLPRAVEIGFCAPFPSMWFATGRQVGYAGRVIGGLETMLMYVVELLAILGLWRERRRLSAWLLLLIAGVGLTALGLVVVNLGTLYRMRYAFWILLIIVGAVGAVQMHSMFSKERQRFKLMSGHVFRPGRDA